MIADDDKLEAIPLPMIGKAPAVAIAIPRREPASSMAEAFFKVATSDNASKTIHDLMRSTTRGGHGHQPATLTKGKRQPALVPLAKAQ
jgi:hypothetical protein